MKKFLIVLGLGLTSLAQAQPVQDVAVVIAHTPRYVTVYQQQCGTQEVLRSGNNGEGKVIGGVAGAAIGSTIGGNSRDRLVGGVVGALVGGAIGNEVSKGPDTIEQRQVCRNIPVTVQQGETVTFQYQGRTFTQIFP